MDITDYTKGKGEFLKAEDIIQKERNKEDPAAVFLVTDYGKMVVNKFGNDRLHIGGEFDGECKILDLSSTNARIIVSLYGEETSEWIGKSIILETYKTKSSEGKLIDAIAVAELQ